MKILAVDNDETALEELRICLGEVFADREILTFTDPMLAVKYMVTYANEIEIIFTALLMRHMDGFELINMMQHTVPGCLAFVVNQTETWEFRKLAWLKGANGYLLKPVTAAAIKDVVQNFIEN